MLVVHGSFFGAATYATLDGLIYFGGNANLFNHE